MEAHHGHHNTAYHRPVGASAVWRRLVRASALARTATLVSQRLA
jgi:hypothetical protein